MHKLNTRDEFDAGSLKMGLITVITVAPFVLYKIL